MGPGQLWLSAAAASAIALAAPLHAQDAAAPAANDAPAPAANLAPASAIVVPAPPVVSDVGVDAYYAAHPGTLLWLGSADARSAAAKLPELLRQAPIDGLADGPSLAAAVEGALTAGQPGDDKTISAAWVRYVQRLKAPVEGVSYGDPALALTAPTADAVLTDAGKASSLVSHVEKIAAVNPFYARLREEAVKQNAASDERVRATLDRLRIIPSRGRAVVVDVPSAQLWMLEDGRPVDSMKVIVGKKAQATPLLAGTIHYVTFNPYWHIPQDIARKRVAPVVLKRGVEYLKLARYQTVADFRDRKDEQIDPLSVDWKAVADCKVEVHVRQLAGPQNMMGKMKFGWVNDHGIFLHDTPKKALFAKTNRALSNGCIRLEDAPRLANWLLGREATPPSDDSEVQVRIDQGVPIYVTYMTAQADEGGTLAFADDVYGIETPDAPKAVIATAASAQ